MKPIQLTGIVWYRSPEQYERFLRLFEDAANLPRTYERWLASAEKGLQDLERRGLAVLRIEIDADEFPLWCAAHGFKLDAHARNQFVLDRLAPNR